MAAWRLGQIGATVFSLSEASTRLRGRADARGRPIRRAPGLTRTTGQRAGIFVMDDDVAPSAASPVARFRAALQRRRRCSSISKSAGAAIQHSRQARRTVRTPAAGIDAASMAASMPLPNIKTAGSICPNRQAATSEGGWGTLTGEVKEGIRPQGEGGTGARQSPPPSLLRPSRHATATAAQPTNQPAR